MGYFKIKNITNDLGKRHPKANTPLNIDFKDLFKSNSTRIEPGFEITIETNYLPVSAQKLRAEGLITVIEIDKNSYQQLLKSQELQKKEKVILKEEPKVDEVLDLTEEEKRKRFKQRR